MTLYNPGARLLWSSTLAGPGNTFKAAYQSGDVNLRDVTDVWLAVAVDNAPTGTTPTLDVELQLKDATAHYFAGLIKVTQLTTAGVAQVSAGQHIATTATSIVLPERGRIAVAVGGTATPTFTGVSISLYGR